MSRPLVRLGWRVYGWVLPISHLWFAVAVVLGALAAPAAAAAQSYPCCGAGIGAEPPASAGAQRVRQIGMTVADMDRSVEFYTRVLGFTVEQEDEQAGGEWERLTDVFGVRLRRVTLRLGQERLQLTEFLAATVAGRPVPVDSRSNDRWFQHIAIITSDMDSAYRRLRAHRVRHASTGPQLLPKSIPGAAGIRAFYFRDPDGHALEILQFPPDKGEARWHARGALFLGIDHTAIVVASTERSLAFYRDLLGLTVAGHSENRGPEQAHLNNVEDAHLRITTLRAPSGPGVEFLEYLHPQSGRPYPADARSNDLLHWQTTVVVPMPDSAAARAAGAGGNVLSRLAGRNRSDTAGVLIRDPDGHAVHLVAP